MLKTHYDESEASGLLYFIETLTDEEYEKMFEVVRMIRKQSPSLSYRPSVLCVVRSGVAMPTPKQRAAIAAETKPREYNPYLAVATTGFVPRALLTAISWVQGESPWTLGAHGTIEAAVEWLEKTRGTRLPLLRGIIKRMEASL